MSGIHALTVPKWGMAMEEGTLVNWLVKEGDVVKIGDEVAEIESSKIVNVLESHYEGVMRRQIAKEDDTLPLGALLAVIADKDVTDDEIDSFINGFTNVLTEGQESAAESAVTITETKVQPSAASSSGAADQPESRDDSDVRATPSARRLARELGVNLHDCRATGSRGRICEDDVREASTGSGTGSGQTTEQSREQGDVVTEIPMSPIRQRIAQRLQESASTIPHYRLISDARIDALLALHKRFKDTAADAAITINDILVKACAAALVQVPDCNVQFDNGVIKRFKHADIAVAVALDAGLITPIVRGADTRDIAAIAAETKELVKRARAGILRPDEYEGGTFTISNLGMFGVRQFDAIINPPQCAILAIGKGEQRMLVTEGQAGIATVMTMTLSLDHRIIDGAVGAKFLQTLVNIIENPEQMCV